MSQVEIALVLSSLANVISLSALLLVQLERRDRREADGRLLVLFMRRMSTWSDVERYRPPAAEMPKITFRVDAERFRSQLEAGRRMAEELARFRRPPGPPDRPRPV